MVNTTRNLMAVVAAAAGLFAATAATAAEPQQTRIVLRVSDAWQLPPDVLSRAQAEVAAIYERIGVEVIWTAPDGSVNDTQTFTVVILSRERGLKKIAADGVGENVMGQARKGTGYAYIFTQRVRDTAARRGICFEKLLGKIVAHEVGHLLLTNGHSDVGIMQPAIPVRTNTSEWFTPVQGATIRAELAGLAN